MPNPSPLNFDMPCAPVALAPDPVRLARSNDMPLHVTVTTPIVSPNTGKPIWFVMQTDHATVEELHLALAEDGCVYGLRLETERRGGAFEIVGSTPQILGVLGVGTIKPCHLELTGVSHG